MIKGFFCSLEKNLVQLIHGLLFPTRASMLINKPWSCKKIRR